ncbi:MAG: tRNA dihydrouridine synthase DusB [Thiotrichales bacterium]
MNLLKPVDLGSVILRNNVLLAPMAGVTDQPFRKLCWQMGAGLTTTEMVAANQDTWSTKKSALRLEAVDPQAPLSIQIVGSAPQQLADGARHYADLGADLIDINMGCPAKKVCRKAAGSALLADERLVGQILEAVVAAVNVPVTLKIRTGVSAGDRNAPRVARIAEQAGVKMIAIHGRTRAEKFKGAAEYETIREVCSRVSIPVIANGDISSPEDAARVIQQTQADGIMVGRAALGAPWLFREITSFLNNGVKPAAPQPREIQKWALTQLAALHQFYGPDQGVRIARKHIAWYFKSLPDHRDRLREINSVNCAGTQYKMVEQALSSP